MFFALRNFLLDYTNKKYNINCELENLRDISNSQPEEVQQIREKLWSDKNIIKEYIQENPNNIDKKGKRSNKTRYWNGSKIKLRLSYISGMT